MMKQKDVLFKKSKSRFRFDLSVAEVFDDMAERSIPCYSDIQRIISALVRQYYRQNTYIYDIGCSTGNTILEIHKNLRNYKLIAVDKSSAMLDIAKKKCRKLNIDWICGDIKNTKFSDASVVICNFVIQFIKKTSRQAIINNIYNGLQKDGLFIFCEKVVSSDKALETTISKLYNDYKLGNNYSQEEIDHKNRALKGLLDPETADNNIKMLKNAGFKHIDTIFKYLNFICLIAKK